MDKIEVYQIKYNLRFYNIWVQSDCIDCKGNVWYNIVTVLLYHFSVLYLKMHHCNIAIICSVCVEYIVSTCYYILWTMSSKTLQVTQTKFWPSCRIPQVGRWAPNHGEDSASARCWTEGKVHTDISSLSRALRPTMLCWCWIRALGRTLGTQWSSSMWTWMWQRRDAPIWMAFTWVSHKRLVVFLCMCC